MRSIVAVARGMILLGDLGKRTPPMHEQLGERPCIVVGLPRVIQDPKYAMVTVLPMSSQLDKYPPGELYPLLLAIETGLPLDSVVLLDQLTTADFRRFRFHLATLSDAQMEPLTEKVVRILGFESSEDKLEGITLQAAALQPQPVAQEAS